MKTKQMVGTVFGSILKLVVLMAVIVIVYKGAVWTYDYGYRVFMEPAISLGDGRTVTVTITGDMTALEIGELLAGKGLVRDGRLFAIQYLVSEFRKDVTSGVFELSTSMTAEEMMEEMAKTTETTEEDS